MARIVGVLPRREVELLDKCAIGRGDRCKGIGLKPQRCSEDAHFTFPHFLSPSPRIGRGNEPQTFSAFQNGTCAGTPIIPLMLARCATGGAHWPRSAIGT